MQFLNNNHWEDYLLAGATMTIDFSGKTLELKYFARTEKEAESLIQNKSKIKESIKKIKSEWKIDKVFCRFFFRKLKPNTDLQKSLVDFQKDVFDEVAVHLIGTRFNDFKQVYEYAVNKDLIVSPIADISILENHAKELFDYAKLQGSNNIRFTHRKINKFLARYFFISDEMKKHNLKVYLTGCTKRCNIEGFDDIDVSIIAKGLFKFHGCCLDYRPASKRTGKRGFSPTMSVFNLNTFEWGEEKNENFRANRLQNHIKLDSAKSSQNEIDKRPKVKQLFEILLAQKK